MVNYVIQPVVNFFVSKLSGGEEKPDALSEETKQSDFRIGELESRMSKLESRMSKLKARMDTSESRMDEFEATMNRLESRMDKLEESAPQDTFDK